MTTIEYDNAPARRKNVETDVSSPIFELLVLAVKISDHFQREGLYLNLFEYFGLIRDFEPFHFSVTALHGKVEAFCYDVT